MILYDLVCNNDHTFESWFRNSTAADKVLKAGQSPCPQCGSVKVRKAPMAPRVAKHDRGAKMLDASAANYGVTPLPAANKPLENVAQAMEKAAAALAELRDTIEKNFEHVGAKFPEEARRIHYGEAPERAIYGDATREDAEALRRGRHQVAAIPWPKRGAISATVTAWPLWPAI